MINPMELTGKKVIVAGASSEVGKAIVTRLGKLGAKVVMIDKFDEEPVEVKDKTGFYSFDIYDVKGLESNLKIINQETGPFDGFVFAAGIGGVRPLSFTKVDFVHNMMSANVYTFIETVRSLVKNKGITKGGSIVSISSVSSIKGLKSKVAYSASKAALDAAVRSLAAELSSKHIRVNSILKGWVSSDMDKDFIKSNRSLNENDDFQKQLLGVIEPYELANTVAFLLSDATKTITGTSLLLDGGYTL